MAAGWTLCTGAADRLTCAWWPAVGDPVNLVTSPPAVSTGPKTRSTTQRAESLPSILSAASINAPVICGDASLGVLTWGNFNHKLSNVRSVY